MKFNKLAWCLGLLFAASACLAQVNPVPLINQPLVPAAIAPGGSDFILTVNGTGFVPGSVVFWNGSPRKTTFISGSRLTAAIRASDIATDGTAFVTVASPSPGGGNSNVEFFQITNPQSSISFNMTDYTVGHAPEFLVTADFNGDGTLDLATSNISDNTVSILLGRGDGTFQLPTTYQAGGEPITIAAADFNNDGKADLAVVNYCPGFPLCGPATVSIFIGTGDGTFQPQMTYPVALHPGAGLVVADFNGDGNLDLVTTSSSRSTVGILLGNGNGTFQPFVEYNAGPGAQGVTAGDFNGDGKLDLAVANCCLGTEEGQCRYFSETVTEVFRLPFSIRQGPDTPTELLRLT